MEYSTRTFLYGGLLECEIGTTVEFIPSLNDQNQLSIFIINFRI